MATAQQTPSSKWALITGCSPGGLGDAEATAFLTSGINVIATALETKTIEHITPTLDNPTSGFLIRLHLDITSSKSLSEAYNLIKQLTNGHLHFLINNAGYGYYSPLLDVDISLAKKQYDVNVWGALSVTQTFFPLLRAAKGTIVNQASVAGLSGFSRPYMGVYSSSKAALLSLTDIMRLEFDPFGIKVVALVSGAVKTEFAKNMKGGTVSETSWYSLIREDVEKLMLESSATEAGHDRHQVARKVVEELLKDKPANRIVNGYMGTVIWLLHSLLPLWMLDGIHWSGSGLDKLKAIVAGRTAEKND
ncbi:unnamed protein product [Cercospora beticola]|nr:unnamed protein product [Cercospora beticola]